jgi:hypothetical protein
MLISFSWIFHTKPTQILLPPPASPKWPSSPASSAYSWLPRVDIVIALAYLDQSSPFAIKHEESRLLRSLFMVTICSRSNLHQAVSRWWLLHRHRKTFTKLDAEYQFIAEKLIWCFAFFRARYALDSINGILYVSGEYIRQFTRPRPW